MANPCPTNPEKSQDRVADLVDNLYRYGYAMFPQQRAIYRQLVPRVRGRTVLEAGCGVGVGTALLSQAAKGIVGTDVSRWNIAAAEELYPWLTWAAWDVQKPWAGPAAEVVVCVEALEHVADAPAALENLLAAATQEVWISTPNGKDKPRPPSNPFHVQEFTVYEVRWMLAELGVEDVQVFGWEDFRPLPDDTDVSPLVYRITL